MAITAFTKGFKFGANTDLLDKATVSGGAGPYVALVSAILLVNPSGAGVQFVVRTDSNIIFSQSVAGNTTAIISFSQAQDIANIDFVGSGAFTATVYAVVLVR